MTPGSDPETPLSWYMSIKTAEITITYSYTAPEAHYFCIRVDWTYHSGDITKIPFCRC